MYLSYRRKYPPVNNFAPEWEIRIIPHFQLPCVLSLTRPDARFFFLFNFAGETNFREECYASLMNSFTHKIGKRNERNTIRELDSRCARKWPCKPFWNHYECSFPTWFHNKNWKFPFYNQRSLFFILFYFLSGNKKFENVQTLKNRLFQAYMYIVYCNIANFSLETKCCLGTKLHICRHNFRSHHDV